jgi:ABC-2 type transport system permease protein
VKGVGVLLRHQLRCDRWHLVWWTLGLSLLYVSQAVGVDELYVDQAEFDRAAEAMAANPALIALAGPARALNTLGGQVMWQASAFGAVFAGLMCMLLLGRHTRSEEETGRDELVRSSAVDRHAPLAAAVLLCAVASVLVGVGVAGALVLYGLDAADSWATGLGLTCTAWVFAAVAALAAQLTASTRSMYAIVGLVIGGAYLARMVGDVTGGALSWVSPIGWYQSMHPFSGLRWWPAAISLGATAVLLVGAFAVFARRDHGAGVVPPSPGPARGGPASVGGLFHRLQRPTVVGWVIGMACMGLAFGSMGPQVAEMVGTSDYAEQLYGSGQGLVDGFHATSLTMIGMIASGFAISAALRWHAEEQAGRVEPVLAGAVTRRGALTVVTALVLVASAVVQLAAGAGMAIAQTVAAQDPRGALDLLGASLVQLPAVWVLCGVTFLTVGAGGRWVVLAWAPLILAVGVLLLTPVLRLPDWVEALSPFHHLPAVPAEPMTWAGPIGLALLALVLLAGSVAVYGRRDLA